MQAEILVVALPSSLIYPFQSASVNFTKSPNLVLATVHGHLLFLSVIFFEGKAKT